MLKQNIYYAYDEESGRVTLDLYEMEQEALKQLKEKFPDKEVESVYVS
tara:strand:+ start:128 stop:271 length:144 start_codon:yes stop_codon:yes gene_type:complete